MINRKKLINKWRAETLERRVAMANLENRIMQGKYSTNLSDMPQDRQQVLEAQVLSLQNRIKQLEGKTAIKEELDEWL